ncbi:MAG: hypothetical protein DRN71_05200 [Candidatus Nanohalarchaeota archaeon]|nr:MAG: hypothetical protein DRN71_05200 [Candidatus Nanohaloarchaeota archaeon]
MIDMKGVSVAVMGFIIIGLAIAGLIWMQYNANMGISEKISSTDTLVFSRLNEESYKVISYAEMALGQSGSHALGVVAKRGGWRNDDIRYWQCIVPQVPSVSEVMAEVNDETLALVNLYLSLIESEGDIVDFVSVDGMSCVNTEFSDDKKEIVARGSGLNVMMSDGSSFVSNKNMVVEKNMGTNYFRYDYEVLKDWVSDDVVRENIEKKLNDGAIMPMGLSFESCSCIEPYCPDAGTVAERIFPCWEARIRYVVETSVDEAVRDLVDDYRYFGGKNVSCDAHIRCISIREPVVVNEKRRSYESDGCCSESCASCLKDRCALRGTAKICNGVSSESVCERPDCDVDPDYREYCVVSGEKYDVPVAEEWLYGEEEEEEVCETCCGLSFGLIYDTDVDFTLVCRDRSTMIARTDGMDALEWRVNLFVSAVSTTGADYSGDVDPGCG